VVADARTGSSAPSDESGCEPSEHLLADDQRLEVARLVGTGRASYIDQDNRLVGTSSLAAAVTSRRAYFVEVRDGILALDFDNEETADFEARWAYSLLRIAGFLPVMCASGGDSRRHVFCRIGKAEASRVLSPMGLGVTDQRMRRTIRPPYTPHRSGATTSRSLLIDEPTELVERLRSSGYPLGHAARGVFNSRTSRDRSATIFSAALGAANANWSFDEFLLVLDCSEIPISELFAARVEEQGREATVNWLRDYVWTRAVQQVATTPAIRRREIDPGVRATLAWVLDQEWPSTKGAIDRSVAVALLWGRRRAGRMTFDMSERDIALSAGVSRSAAQAALARLQGVLVDGEPFLVRHGVEDARQRVHLSSSWHMHSVPQEYTMAQAVFERIVSIVEHDVFRNNGGLGTSSRLIYISLTHRGMLRFAELVKRTGLSKDTVRRHLVSLEAEGLVAKVDDEWSITDKSLDEVRGLRSAGRALSQADQYARERHARDIGHRRNAP
jgi:DNA-binding transcriptional ArsR family regulator